MGKQSSNSLARQLHERVQNRLEAVLDGMPVAVSWADLKSGEILFINKKFHEMFGYELGDHSTVENWIQQAYPNPVQVERAMKMWAPHFETTAIVPFEIQQVEVDVKCKDGSVKTTLLSGMILPNERWALAIFSDITERKEAEERIQKQALEDPLTGLGNRRAFAEELEDSLKMARRREGTIALLIVDLDEFKPLNDTLGHESGDRVLRAVAERLRHGVRGDDFVSRVGGDEFCVIVKGRDAESSAEEVAERILSEVRKPYSLDGNSISLSLSVGIATFPNDARDADSLYRRADKALYRAKDAGRGCWSR